MGSDWNRWWETSRHQKGNESRRRIRTGHERPKPRRRKPIWRRNKVRRHKMWGYSKNCGGIQIAHWLRIDSVGGSTITLCWIFGWLYPLYLVTDIFADSDDPEFGMICGRVEGLNFHKTSNDKTANLLTPAPKPLLDSSSFALFVLLFISVWCEELAEATWLAEVIEDILLVDGWRRPALTSSQKRLFKQWEGCGRGSDRRFRLICCRDWNCLLCKKRLKTTYPGRRTGRLHFKCRRLLCRYFWVYHLKGCTDPKSPELDKITQRLTKHKNSNKPTSSVHRNWILSR